MGRIECGGGEGGEPALSPPGWKTYASCVRSTPAARDVGACRAIGPCRLCLTCPLGRLQKSCAAYYPSAYFGYALPRQPVRRTESPLSKLRPMLVRPLRYAASSLRRTTRSDPRGSRPT